MPRGCLRRIRLVLTMSEPAPGEAVAGIGSEIDTIWTSSRTARQIYALGEVEKASRCERAPYY